MNEQLTLFDVMSDYLESDINKFNKKNAKFRIHASLIYKLGESLIADEVTALSELIKNSYDADAKFCHITIDTSYVEYETGTKGIIEISDDGCGMDLETIVNGWLTISNSPKKKMKRQNKTTPKFKRYPLGDKGLGRLAVQKLGKNVQMITKTTSSTTEYTITIPWGDFLRNTTIDEIPVKIDENIVNNEKSYTRIVIKDLVDPEKWNSKEQSNILTNSISKIISPFESKDNTFRVYAKINGQPLEPVETIFKELLSTARAKHTISYSSGKTKIIHEYKKTFFYNRDVFKMVSAGEFSLNETTLKDFLTVNQTKLSNVVLTNSEGIVFEAYDECDFSNILPKRNDPGDFLCEIYEYSMDPPYIKYLYDMSYISLIEHDEYRGFIDRFHGIKVICDGFIVQGYGEGDGGDWLGLSSSSKTKGYFFDFRNDSVIGCVYLTGNCNSVLKEKTNREGFVEDDFYKAFKQILDTSIRRINNNRKKLNDAMKEYVNNMVFNSDNTRSDLLDYSSKITILREELKQEAKLDLFSNKLDAINYDFEKISERLQDLFELAGLGLSAEMFAHEFDASTRSIISKNQKILNSHKFLSVDDLVKHIHYITHAMGALRKQMSYFNPGLKYVRAEKQRFAISDFLQSHLSFFKERFEKQGIEPTLEIATDFNVLINRGLLSQVFDNLVSNSEYWLEISHKTKFIKNKKFFISTPERGIIIVWDNGIGISKDIERRLFEPFESNKPNGRGLGLYIAINNLRYCSARIRLLGQRNLEGNLYKFEIDLSQVTE